MIEIKKPKIVIHHHWDNFLPPISRIEDLEPLIKYIVEKFPHIELLILEFENDMMIKILTFFRFPKFGKNFLINGTTMGRILRKVFQISILFAFILKNILM